MGESRSGALARSIVSRLRESGWKAWLVGGCVRDLLLGREPGDYDIATDAPPAAVLDLFPRCTLAGAHFGVVIVREDASEVEVATFRSDHAYTDGRHPESVQFERNPRQDVLRRDFTINGLLLDPFTNEVLDYVGGRTDLDARLVRAIGDPETRFAEDHLRMLRAVRFAARLNFQIEPATFAAIGRLHERIRDISAERIRDEIFRILTEGGARRGFELLSETGLLNSILPEVAAMRGVPQPPEFHPEGDVWTHTLLMLEGLRNPTPTLAMGVLLHDVGKPPTFAVAERIRFDGHVEKGVEIAAGVLERLRFSRRDQERILALIANHLRFKDVRHMRESTLKRFLRMDGFEEHLELHRLDCISSHGWLDNYAFVKSKLAEAPPEVLKPPRLLTGHDLMAAGYRQGPAFSTILRDVEDAQLERTLSTRDEALDFVRSRYAIPDGARITAQPDDN